jgi:hypothetical protein
VWRHQRTLDSVARFSGVHSVDLHFPATFGAEQCEIQFVGLKGEYSEVGTRSSAECVPVVRTCALLGCC